MGPCEKAAGRCKSATGTGKQQCRTLQEEGCSQNRVPCGRSAVYNKSHRCFLEIKFKHTTVFHNHLPVHKCTQPHGQTVKSQGASSEFIPLYLFPLLRSSLQLHCSPALCPAPLLLHFYSSPLKHFLSGVLGQ